MINSENKDSLFKIDDDTAAELKALIKKFDKFCFGHKLPYFLSVAVGNGKDSTEYTNSIRTGLPMNIELTDDKLIKYEKVYRGYALIAPDQLPDIEF